MWCVLVIQLCLTFLTLWAVACQSPLSMEFSRQEYWSKLQFPSPEDLLDSGIKHVVSCLAGRFFTSEPSGKPKHVGNCDSLCDSLCIVTAYVIAVCIYSFFFFLISPILWLIWKDPEVGKDWRQEKGTTEDEMVGWHHQLNGHEFG